MRIDCALLCDSVTIREGLLHILGGGITRANRPQYPAPLGMAMAIRIVIHPSEADSDHKLRMLCQSEDGKPIAEMEADFGVTGEITTEPGEEIALNMPVVMYDLQLPTAGTYSFELLIDGIHQQSVPFIALPPIGRGSE